MSLNNSHKNGYRNHTRIFYKNIFRPIDRSLSSTERMQSIILRLCGFLSVREAGRRSNRIIALLMKICAQKKEVGWGGENGRDVASPLVFLLPIVLCVLRVPLWEKRKTKHLRRRRRFKEIYGNRSWEFVRGYCGLKVQCLCICFLLGLWFHYSW